MSFEEQSALVSELRGAVRNPETVDDDNLLTGSTTAPSGLKVKFTGPKVAVAGAVAVGVGVGVGVGVRGQAIFTLFSHPGADFVAVVSFRLPAWHQWWRNPWLEL